MHLGNGLAGFRPVAQSLIRVALFQGQIMRYAKDPSAV
jgi:hypothetical protein